MTGLMHQIIVVFVLLLSFSNLVYAQGTTSRENHRSKSLDPMNRPMDELGVTGKDDTLCSDRWHSCTTYDRLQFDQKYPGQRLNELLLYGEPSWPDRDSRLTGHGTHKADRTDYGDRIDDRLDKD